MFVVVFVVVCLWLCVCGCVCVIVSVVVCVSTPVSKDTNLALSFPMTLRTFVQRQQGVVARQRVYHQRRRSLSLGDTGTDHPSVPAQF